MVKQQLVLDSLSTSAPNDNSNVVSRTGDDAPDLLMKIMASVCVVLHQSVQ